MQRISTAPTPAQLVNNAPLQAYAAFGQGTSVASDVATPLQMALVAEGIANRGTVMTPHVMAQIRDSQGNLVTSYTPKSWLQATNPLTAAAVTYADAGRRDQWDRVRRSASPPPGTWPRRPGRPRSAPQLNPLTNDWMVAFAPANDPKVAVAVAVPNQVPSSTGAEISGPVTKTILGDALAATP